MIKAINVFKHIKKVQYEHEEPKGHFSVNL